MKKIAIVGSRGQDGRLLSDILAARGARIAGIHKGGVDYNGLSGPKAVDIMDAGGVSAFMESVSPDEIYFLAAFHHSSQDRCEENASILAQSRAVHVDALRNFLEAMRRREADAPRLLYAASSLVFGAPNTPVQNEGTPLRPTEAYGLSKAEGMALCREYRRGPGVYASCAILYNHESAYRQPRFVSRKIVQGVAAAKRGKIKRLVLGDLRAERDWGYAPDYADAMRRMLELDSPEDFVVATGEIHSVGEFAREAFAAAGLDWKDFVEEDPRLIKRDRPALKGDSSKLRGKTGWRPRVGFRDMVRLLVEAELSC